jgi:catechol 2,3-dioxygenase-like lactoylglutathione lyase family enzyme
LSPAVGPVTAEIDAEHPRQWSELRRFRAVEVPNDENLLAEGVAMLERPLWHLRVARPVSDLAKAATMYVQGLGLRVVDEFRDHDGFDGVMLGDPAVPYHFEFTCCRAHPVAPRPTPEDLVVFYIPDGDRWARACERMSAAGFTSSEPINPYWRLRGRTFVDGDGYRTVLQHDGWHPAPERGG